MEKQKEVLHLHSWKMLESNSCVHSPCPGPQSPRRPRLLPSCLPPCTLCCPPSPLSLSMCVRVFTCPRHRRNHQLDRPHLSARGPVYAHPPGPRSSFGLSSGPRPLPPPEIKQLLSALPPQIPEECLSTSHDAHRTTGSSFHRQAA